MGAFRPRIKSYLQKSQWGQNLLRRGEKSKGGKIKSNLAKPLSFGIRTRRILVILIITIKRMARCCPAGERSRVPRPGEAHCPQSPRSSRTGLLQLRIQPGMFCIVSPRLFKCWDLGKVQTFPYQEEQKAVCFHWGWFVFFFPCYIFLGSKATAGPQRALSWAIKFPITHFCFLCCGI